MPLRRPARRGQLHRRSVGTKGQLAVPPIAQIPLPRISERRLLVLVSAVQFVNILDFMVVMPLGPDFSQELGIPLSRMGWIGGSYTAAAALSGIVAARFLDRFDRRSALAVTMLGLVFGTAFGGLSRGLTSLMAARVVAGAFGGPASALALSIVADAVPPERRGRALGIVMGAFSVATVAGLPASLELARQGGWRGAFFALAIMGALVAAGAVFLMPPLRQHLMRASQPLTAASVPVERGPWLLTFVATFTTMMAGFAIVPNISAYVQGNLHYPRAELGTLYLAGGTASFLAMRALGPLVDRLGAAFTALLGTLVFVALLASAFVLEWKLPVTLIYVGFMCGMATRNVSLGALSTRVPLAHERARFMSIQSSVQHGAAALGAVVSAQLLHERPDHSLEGMPYVASMSITLAVCLPWLLRRIEKRLAPRPALVAEQAPPEAA
jgi:predicted MFS family arabinose efflux permease